MHPTVLCLRITLNSSDLVELLEPNYVKWLDFKYGWVVKLC